MCLIVFANDCHPRYSLILGANRDEYRDRASEPSRFWADCPRLLAGRDKLAGGTWLGVADDGRFAAITNYRDPRQQVVDPPSRGVLVSDFLRDPLMTPADFRMTHNRDGERYDGFNLIYGYGDEMHYFTNRGGSSGPIPAGVHGLSNHLLDTGWPKLTVARARLAAIVEQSDPDAEQIFEALSDPAPFADDMLPDTGVGPERERLLSPIFITGEGYGTRSTTVLLIERCGQVTFVERTFDPAVTAPVTLTHSFRIRPAAK